MANRFEASFSAGLDLSELIPTNSSITSASAELLRIKKEEALKKQQDVQEEALMQEKAAKNAEHQLKRLKDDANSDTQPLGFYGSLVSMHGADISGAKKERSGAKTKAQKRTTLSKFKTNNKKSTTKLKSKRLSRAS
jgi:hypothetical protein